MMKSRLLFTVLTFLSTVVMAQNYDYQGEVNSFEADTQIIEIDYQRYQMTLDTLVIGASKRGEHGAEITTGQTVQFDTIPNSAGPPIITHIITSNPVEAPPIAIPE